MLCERCGKELTSKKSIEREEGPYGPTCFRIISLQKQEPIVEQSGLVSAVVTDLLERVRKIELDNRFMKHQLKHQHFSVTTNPDANLEWQIKPEIQKVIDVFEGKFVSIIKDLKEVIETGKPLLKEKFRYSNEDLGTKSIEEINIILIKRKNKQLGIEPIEIIEVR